MCMFGWGRGRRAEWHLRILLTPRKCIFVCVCDFRSSKDKDDDENKKNEMKFMY